ncbi:hypothetical protein DEHRE_02895 [Dehalobacter restrictus DSM 9455]|jgi:hypothetical protein|uniref:Uncharacterized protein n=1 Tax=Dehalobacter restrictus (strain DSM 9455 / PER-K23) TaxID=871738 RepID=A0ABN4C1M1_DEHRP|nr:hypothetical protein DEHRE_02895 [Dehalobacter restrictus DSM 9455]
MLERGGFSPQPHLLGMNWFLAVYAAAGRPTQASLGLGGVEKCM